MSCPRLCAVLPCCADRHLPAPCWAPPCCQVPSGGRPRRFPFQGCIIPTNRQGVRLFPTCRNNSTIFCRAQEPLSSWPEHDGGWEGSTHASAADRTIFGPLSYRVAVRRQSSRRANMIPILLRARSRRLSCLMGLARDFRPGMQARLPLSFKASRNHSASQPLSASSHSAAGRLLRRAAAPVWSLT